jgi:hypothetical protein
MHVLDSVGIESILGSVKFSPRVVSKLVQACFGSVRDRVYTMVGWFLFSPRPVSKLLHVCLGIDEGHSLYEGRRCFVNT